MRKDNCPWEQLSTRYGNQMVIWRHLEVKRVKFFKLPNFCWRSRTFGLQFWVSPLPVLCLASKWFYFFSCHVIGLAESRQHSPAPGWGWCFGPSVQAGSMPATLPVRSHPDIPCFQVDTAAGLWFSTSVSVLRLLWGLAFRAKFNRPRGGNASLGSQQSQSDPSSHWEGAATRTALSYGKPSPFCVTLDPMQLGLFNHFW